MSYILRPLNKPGYVAGEYSEEQHNSAMLAAKDYAFEAKTTVVVYKRGLQRVGSRIQVVSGVYATFRFSNDAVEQI